MDASPRVRPPAWLSRPPRPGTSTRRHSEGRMAHNDTSRLARRGFLSRLSVAAAGLTTFATSRLLAEPSTAPAPSGGPDGWIDRLTGTDRVVFHTHKQLSPGLAIARNVLTNARDV